MIYSVVPAELADELLAKLQAYYANDPHVEVIVDRRRRIGVVAAPAEGERRAKPRARALSGAVPLAAAS